MIHVQRMNTYFKICSIGENNQSLNKWKKLYIDPAIKVGKRNDYSAISILG